jgi:hypothetical protein
MESTEPAAREITPPQFRGFIHGLRAFSQGERIALYILIGLSIWVITVALRIEWLNYRADFYLPRTDWPEEGNPKWRSRGGANGQLHDWIGTFGQLQYILALALLVLAFHIAGFLRRDPLVWLPITSGLIAIFALSLAVYRGYFTSLGW